MTDFFRIENLFSTLMAESASSLSPSECQEVDRFIEAGEYGLALETLVDIYFEERKTANPEVTNLVTHIAGEMGIDPHAMIQKLHRVCDVTGATGSGSQS